MDLSPKKIRTATEKWCRTIQKKFNVFSTFWLLRAIATAWASKIELLLDVLFAILHVSQMSPKLASTAIVMEATFARIAAWTRGSGSAVCARKMSALRRRCWLPGRLSNHLNKRRNQAYTSIFTDAKWMRGFSCWGVIHSSNLILSYGRAS